MAEDTNKKPKTVTLKPINIAWLAQQSFNESTPENKISDSEVVDRLIDEARLRAKSPTKQKKTALAVDIALLA